ncbi:hypothetical protein P4O66_005212, partial [Electrophorus voltai]
AKVDLITSEPDINMGSDQLILCKAGKEADIQWQKDGEDIDEERHGVEKIDETSSKVVLKKVTLEDSGTYKCICHYGNHEDEATVNIFVYEMPNFGKTETYHEFVLNQVARIPCMVSGKPEVDINWYRHGRPVSNGAGHQKVLPDGTLQIADIQKEDSGTYVCEGRIRGRKILKMLNISISVNVPPTAIIRRKKTNVFAGPNANATITCLVTGLPVPSITWATPPTSDSSRYIYNSDKSELIIPAVVRSDSGKYVCIARNKIGEDSATFELDVSEIPLVTLSQNTMIVQLGESVLVSCNATGHPVPTVSWRRKGNNSSMVGDSAGAKRMDWQLCAAFSLSSVQQRIEGSQLFIENVVPSDGGVYSCEAGTEAAHTTEDFSLISVLVVGFLAPYTEYFVRFAAQNDHFLGGFSAEQKIRTQAKREPDHPVLSLGAIVIEGNSFFIPFKQLDDGGSPIMHYVVRYKMDKEGEDWREKHIPANSTQVHLPQLQQGTNYLIEVLAVNSNGFSSPAKLNFSMPQVASKAVLGKAGVVGIVMVIFLVLLLSVDAFCCYRNHCGLLKFLSRNLFVIEMPVSKSLEEGVVNNAAVDMNGLENPCSSVPKLHAQNGLASGVRSEITCDRAPLTKFE